MLSLETRLKAIEIDKDHLFNVRQNIEYNKPIIKFYNRLLFNTRYNSNTTYRNKIKESSNFNESGIIKDLPYVPISTLENSLSNISNCNNLWLIDLYDSPKIRELLNGKKAKAYLKTNLCKDRFCSNCKKVKQALRMARFMPEIKKVGEYSNLYHLTLTVPNCDDKTLRNTIDRMNKSFARITEFLKGKKKIRGLDFDRYNYVGAIRSLEVTFKRDSYHPHFHVLLALDYDDSEKLHVNSYSKRFGKVVRKFSDFEILIQKIWFLLINGKKVTLSNINNISNIRKSMELSNINDEGYSCSMDMFADENYKELFKYMTKTHKDDGEYFTFKNFVTLYFQLKNLRQIQGYGDFFRLKDVDIESEIDDSFNLVVDTLNSICEPKVVTEKTEELFCDNDSILFSRNKEYKYLRELELEEQKEKEGSGQTSLYVG